MSDKYFYVHKIGSKAAPSVKHYTMSAVLEEAKRLAKQHQGEKFVILEAICIVEANEVVVSDLT